MCVSCLPIWLLGKVAMLKNNFIFYLFNFQSADTKPVLCFGGDTVPIRTVAWAPFEGLVIFELPQLWHVGCLC